MLIGNSFVGFLMTIFAFSGLVFFFESDSPSTIDASGKFFILGVLGLVFWFDIFASAFRYHRFFISTLHLKAKNNSLMEQMRIERSETVKVNKLLIASNEKLDASNAIAMFPVHGDSAVDLI